jgi:hypothetical protein
VFSSGINLAQDSGVLFLVLYASLVSFELFVVLLSGGQFGF